jgi:hypothetical protein
MNPEIFFTNRCPTINTGWHRELPDTRHKVMGRETEILLQNKYNNNIF